MKKNKKNYGYGRDRKTQLELYAMMAPATILIILFSIVPLFGLLIAFKNYRPVSGVVGIFTARGTISKILKSFLKIMILFRC